MTQSFSQYKSVGDSVSLAWLGDTPFHIKALENSDFDGKKGYKIVTKETFKGSELKITDKAKANLDEEQIAEIKKKSFNRFHTTRYAIVNQLNNPKMHEDLAKGEIVGPVKCIYVAKPKKGGNAYWELGAV